MEKQTKALKRNNITYELILETSKVEDVSVCSYGISCKEQGLIKAEIHNISSNRILIENLIKKCNELDLSPEHLLDVVEDILV